MKPVVIKVFIALSVLAIGLFVGWVIVAAQKAPDQLVLTVDGTQATFLVADNAVERYRGLSGKTPDQLQFVHGMAFLFSEPGVRTFSMRGMQFDLDFVWILDNKVVMTRAGIEAPQEGEEPRLVSSHPLKADIVLELPAGQAEMLNLMPGVVVQAEMK